jgi:hypothetical protein
LLSTAFFVAAFSWSLSSCSDETTSGPELRITSPANGAVVVPVGDSVDVKVMISPDDVYRQMEFTSSDPDVFYVNPYTGRVYGMKEGTGTLSVRSLTDSSLSATCRVTVTGGNDIKVEYVMVRAEASNFVVYAPDEYDLGQHVLVGPEFATDKALKYTLTQGEGLVSIDENTGVITGIGDGNVTVRIEAIDGSGKFATVSGSVTTVRPREYTPFDRSAWTITTSHPTQEGDATSGGWEQLIDDPARMLCMGLGKPGRTDTPLGDIVYFIIDMKETKSFDYFNIRHREDIAASHLAVWTADIEVSNDGVNFTQVAADVNVRPAVWTRPNAFVNYEFSTKHSARYFKFIYKSWNTSSGGYMQTNDFNIGTFEIL